MELIVTLVWLIYHDVPHISLELEITDAILLDVSLPDKWRSRSGIHITSGCRYISIVMVLFHHSGIAWICDA